MQSGYIVVYAPDHPLAQAKGLVLEHRKIAWDAGLLDDPSLIVHHRNGVKDDNRIENLEVLTAAEHMAEHESAGRAQRAKTHCPQGHPYDEANTWRNAAGHRSCRACNRDHLRRLRGLRAEHREELEARYPDRFPGRIA
jgi:hypothetical protein